MKLGIFSRSRSCLLKTAAFAIAAMVSLPSNADWTEGVPPIEAETAQDIVIKFDENPLSNPEAACLTVTLARVLHGNPLNTPINVTLFPTLDGVALGDERVVSSPRFKCSTPWGEISLKDNLDAFLNGNDNNMVICPLCWIERYGDEYPDYGFLPGPTSTAVVELFLEAEKVIDF